MANWKYTSQLPREYVLHFCSRLTGTEFKFLIIASDNIGSYPHSRRTQCGVISLSEFMRLSGVSDRTTSIKALRRLVAMGLLRKIGKATAKGQGWKLIRHIDVDGQQSLFREEDVDWSGNQTKGVWKPDQRGRETRPNKRYSKPYSKPRSNVVTNERIEVNAEEQKQRQRATEAVESASGSESLNGYEPNSEAEIIAYLKVMRDSGNGRARASDLCLQALEKFWHLGFKDETVKSWRFFSLVASRSEAIFERALSDTLARVQSGHCQRAPAYFVKLCKTYANEQGVSL